MSTIRKFRGRDAEMLITASTIVQAAIAHKAFLISKRTSWADPFFSDFDTRINTAISTYLGVDNALALRTQTIALSTLIKPAYQNLADVKVQLGQDFKSDKPRLTELLTTLGYTTFWKTVTTHDQESLIQLLYRFRTNLTTTIRTEIVAKGIMDSVLTELVDAADELTAANVTQETIKQSRKVQTQAAATEFNAIYDQAVAIATLSRRIFKGNTAIQDQFSMAKILKNLQGSNLTTLFEAEVQVNPDTPFILSTVRITARSVVYLYTTSTLVYACRNPLGCTSQIEAYLLTPEVQAVLHKTDLVGQGKNLVLTTLTPGWATVKVRIQG